MFDWWQFLQLSEELLDPGLAPAVRESKLRTAISRAYYAAFCSARNYLQARREFTPRGEATDHAEVRQVFQRGGNNRHKIAQRLNELRSYRNQADYDDRIKRGEDVARSAIRFAHEVASTLRSNP